MHRKEFLKKCLALAAGTACLEAGLAGCAPLPYVAFARDGDDAVIQKTDFGEAGFVLLEINDLPAPVYVRRLADGYAAVLLRCTHRGCKVNPAPTLLQCPCHGSRYTPTGEVVGGPAPRNLRRFRVSASAEAVRVHLAERESG